MLEPKAQQGWLGSGAHAAPRKPSNPSNHPGSSSPLLPAPPYPRRRADSAHADNERSCRRSNLSYSLVCFFDSSCIVSLLFLLSRFRSAFFSAVCVPALRSVSTSLQFFLAPILVDLNETQVNDPNFRSHFAGRQGQTLAIRVETEAHLSVSGCSQASAEHHPVSGSATARRFYRRSDHAPIPAP